MFTLNILDMVAMGTGKMKWTQNSPGASIETQNRDVYAELIKVKPENRKTLLESLSLDQLKIIQNRINALKGGTHGNLVWRGQVTTEINRLKEAKAQPVVVAPAAPAQLAPTPVLAAAPQLVAAQQLENTALVVAQAEQVATIKEAVPQETGELRGSVGLTAQSEALQKMFSELSKQKGNESMIDMLKGLKHVNIVSLLQVAKDLPTNTKRLDYEKIKELGYSSDGEFGSTELSAANDFLQTVVKDPIFRDKVINIAKYAEAGLDPTVTLRGESQINKLDANKLDTIIEYFGDVPSGRYSKDTIMKALNELKGRPDFAINIARVANLDGVTDVATLITAIKANPAAKAHFFDNINASAATGVVWIKSFLTGKGAEKAELFTKEFATKAKEAVSTLDKTLADPKASPEDKQKAQEAKDTMEKKGGTTWLTGEIQKVAQAAFVNIGKDANAIGVGVTYEAFVRGLTVSIGAGLGEGGKITPAAVIHYGTGAKLGEMGSNIVSGTVGIGSSVFPVVIPFIDGGISLTDKVTTIGTGRGDVNTIGVQAQWMKVGGVLMLSRTNERADEIAQGQAKLLGAVGKMSELSVGDISSEKIGKILETAGLKSTPKYLEYWTNRVKELYRVNGVDGTTTPGAKALLLGGLIQSEVEKSWIQESQNDKDSESFKGGMVGIGHVFGVYFPVGGLLWKEGHMKYTPGQEVKNNFTETKTLRTADILTKDATGNTWTFKPGEKPTSTVNIDATLGSYDPDKGILKITDPKAIQLTDIKTEGGKLVSFTVSPSKQIQAPEGNIRLNELSPALQGSIYVMNRKSEFKTFNDAIELISDQKYAEAYAKLQAYSKNSSVVRGIFSALDGKDKDLATHPERLQVLLTYTYGAKDVKNATSVDKKAYAQAHSESVKREEKDLAPSRWNNENEAVFAAVDQHKSVALSDLIKEQDLSVSVFATPKGGKHRIDRYEGSLSVSSKIVTSVNEAQKDALIKEHANRITKQVENLQKFLTKHSIKGIEAITTKSYEAMLKTGTIPNEWKDAGIDFDKNTIFFEARAMAAGNICMNKTEGIGYPTFQIKKPNGDIELTRASKVEEVDYIAGSAGYTEVVSGLFGTGVKGERKPDVQNQEFRTEIQTREVRVSPTNIQTIDGNRVIVINTGGTQTNIPLTSLTRPQAMALAQGQSINLSAQVNVQVPYTTLTTGATINRSAEAIALVGNITATEVSTMLSQLLADPTYQFAGDKKK